MTKKVLFHHRTRGFGAEKSHILGVIESFEKGGYSVDLLSPPGVNLHKTSLVEIKKSKDKLLYIKKVFDLLYNALPTNFFGFLELFYNFYSFILLFFKVTTVDYDFIYDRYSIKTISTALVATLFKLPLILEVNDSTFIVRTRKLSFSKISQKIEKYVFSRSAIIVTISNQFKRMIVEKTGIEASKVIVLSNAIDPAKFVLHRDKIISKKIFFEDECLVFGCVGAFVPWHGLDLLIEWTHDIFKENPIVFLFVGDGPVRESVESLAKKYGIDDKVRFTGFVDSSEVPYFLNLLDVCVIPDSNIHGSPMKLFEQMVMSKPSIVPSYSPLLDVVTDGEEVLFFEPKDKESFRVSFLKLVKSPELRERLGLKARKCVLNKHTWDVNFDSLKKKMAEDGVL